MNTAKTPVFTLGHSPDADDAFMFYGLAEHKIDTMGYEFEHTLQDIQTLNERAKKGELHISAISIHAYAYVLDQYALLPSGASMGDGYGPLIVAKSTDGLPENADFDTIRKWIQTKKIAVPGLMTSAYLSLQIFAESRDLDIIAVPFDDVYNAITSGQADIGVLIHEGQITYKSDGFLKVLDLGEWWKETTGLPLPLGGNVVRKDIAPEVRSQIAKILYDSIDYGLKNRQAGLEHSLPLARGMDPKDVDQFIGMYVNDYTLDYGDDGRKSIELFLKRAADLGIIPAPVDLEFVQY